MAPRTTPDAHRQAKNRILERAEREKVKFMRLQFTDILGANKNVEVPDRTFEEALDGRIMFDGSSIEGFVRIEESDMYLKPDLSTFQVFPWADANGARVGRLICDIANPDGSPFAALPPPDGSPVVNSTTVCVVSKLSSPVESVKVTGVDVVANVGIR